MPQQAVDFFLANYMAKQREQGFQPKQVMAKTAHKKAFNAIRNGRSRERAEVVDFYVVSICTHTFLWGRYDYTDIILKK